MIVLKTCIEHFEGNPIEFRTDGFVNATLMCAPFGKRPNDFMSTPGTKAFLEALSGVENQIPENLVFTQRGVGGGTWMHPDLALECARWLAPRFAVWCNRVIRGILANGDFEIPKTRAEALRLTAEALEKVEALEAKAAEDAPKIEFYDQVVESKNVLSLNDSAKLLGIGRNKMMELCRCEGILDRRNIPYQRYIDAGYFRVVESSYQDNHGQTHITKTTRVFQRGLDYLRQKFAELLPVRETR